MHVFNKFIKVIVLGPNIQIIGTSYLYYEHVWGFLTLGKTVCPFVCLFIAA
jgi:hypothetical protein